MVEKNLLEIRQDFIELSGREDLATTTEDDYDTDAGADNYIQAAIRTLDARQETPVSESQLVRTIRIGDYLVTFRGCKAVTQVWRESGSDGQVEVDRYNMTEMREEYPKLANEDQGVPSYYSPYPVVRPPEQRPAGMAVNFSGIILMPPSDGTYTVTVVGMFQCLMLEKNYDTNFWSVNYPDILVLAALRELEFPYRNTAGAKDYTQAIDLKLDGVDKDLAERAFSESSDLVMEG